MQFKKLESVSNVWSKLKIAKIFRLTANMKYLANFALFKP